MVKAFFSSILIVFGFFPLLADNTTSKIIEKHFKKGALRIHIPKTGGSQFGRILGDDTSDDKVFLNTPHVVLSESLESKPEAVPVVTLIRDPRDRVVSMLRYSKDKFDYVKFNDKFRTALKEADLTNVECLKELSNIMVGKYPNFQKNFRWPLRAYAEYFSPPNMDYTSMDDKKVAQCVAYALKNIDFIGEVEQLEDNIHKFNLAFNLNLNPSLVRGKLNKLSSTAPQMDVTKPDVKNFLDDLLKWEYKIYHQLRAAERWKVAIPCKNKTYLDQGYVVTQYTLPMGFDPDKYYKDHKDNLSTMENDIWVRRKWAMLDFINKNNNLIVTS